jgi:hypothetical protein
MTIEERYRIEEYDYDENGFNQKTGLSFAEQLKLFEKDFFEKYPYTPANCLYIGHYGMQLLKRCYLTEDEEEWESEVYGQDLIYDDIEANYEVNRMMDSASSKTIVYAISTAIDIEEPLFLYVDDKQRQNTLTLKYISEINDDDDDNDDDIVIPPSDEVLNKQLKTTKI